MTAVSSIVEITTGEMSSTSDMLLLIAREIL